MHSMAEGGCSPSAVGDEGQCRGERNSQASFRFPPALASVASLTSPPSPHPRTTKSAEWPKILGSRSPGSGETELFLRPGDPFRVVDGLLTNFHLPRSSLLLLVCAFAGRSRVLAAYREAIERGYRFYSYGDAMLVL